MKQTKLYSILSVLLVAAMLLTACPAPAPAPVAEQPAVAQAPAGGSTSSAADVVEITYTFRNSPQPDTQMVQDALNEIITPMIGVKLILEPIDPGVYNEKMQLRLAAGEKCDVIFTAPWTNSYANNVANGVLYPLDDLLPDYAPGLWASMPETTWNAARINGTIYGVINQQIFPKPWGWHVRKDMLEKYDFSMDNVKRWEDMEPLLAMIKDGEGITPINDSQVWYSQYWGYDPLDDGIAAIGMKANDTELRVVNFLETPEFQEAANIAKRWQDNGWVPADVVAPDEMQAAFRAGLYAMGHHVEKPGNDVEVQNRYGYEFVSKNLTDPLIIDTAGTIATMNAICASSPHPQEAMEILELFNTNEVVYNTLARGIEGVHWVWEDEANRVMRFPDGVTADTSSYNPNVDWMIGNQFNAYYRSAAQVGAWEATKRMNDTAFPSEALGFVVDRQPIETEVAQVNAVWLELVVPIFNGWVAYDEAAPEAMGKLKDAGIDTIIAEIENQLQTWANTNK